MKYTIELSDEEVKHLMYLVSLDRNNPDNWDVQFAVKTILEVS